LHWIGRKERLPLETKNKFLALVEKTKNFTALDLCLAIDYGARTEIMDAVKKIFTLYQEKKISPAQIEEMQEDFFESQLYTANLPPVDLIIRTAGEYRLSNFLLWQAAYSELYFMDRLWPEVETKDLEIAILSYNQRKRTKGKIFPKKNKKA